MARIEERDYAGDDRGDLTGKSQREMGQAEVELYNLDYDRLSDNEVNVRLNRILEDGREYFFEVVRFVMERANQRYGGATALGDEIGIQLIRPDHMDMGANPATGLADSWQFTWVATGDQDLFGAAGAANDITMDDNSIAESLLILAWTTNHAAPKTEALQATQFSRDMFVQPLPWDAVSDERGNLKVIEANPWFVAFPGESFEIDVNVFVTGTDVLRAYGVYSSIGTNIHNVVG